MAFKIAKNSYDQCLESQLNLVWTIWKPINVFSQCSFCLFGASMKVKDKILMALKEEKSCNKLWLPIINNVI